MSTTTIEKKTEIANPTKIIEDRVKAYVEKGQLHLPPNYSPENALKAAYLTLVETIDRDKMPVLTSCTQPSIQNSLLNMVIQGLDPAKKQCYFIAYGKTLQCQRSYFGDIALVKRVMPGVEVNAACFYKGDKISYQRTNGKITGVNHEQDAANMVSANLEGAYCVITDADGVVIACEVMPMERIRKSWGMSKTYNASAKSGTHADFADEMAMRTVIRKCCKPIINSSNDEFLMRAVAESEMDEADAQIAEDAGQNAHADTVTLDESQYTEDSADDSATEQPDEEDHGNESAQQEDEQAPF